MLKRLFTAVLACLLLCVACAYANPYEYVDPTFVKGADELPWATVVGLNDVPMDNNAYTADHILLDNTGTKIEMPDDPIKWCDWMTDIQKNQTDGKGDLAFVKCSDENFLRVVYDLDDQLVMDYKCHTYSDDTRVMINGLTGYAAWNTGSDSIQHGAKVVYDTGAGTCTVTEFNVLSMDGSFSDVYAAAYLGYLRGTSDYTAYTQSTGLLLRAEPASDGEVLATIAKDTSVGIVYDYTYHADNGYDYMPVYYENEDGVFYGWVARDFLGVNPETGAVSWTGCAAKDLEYPTAGETAES